MQSLLSQAVYPHPAPAIIALLVVLGLYYLGDLIARRFYQKNISAVEIASGFIFLVLLTGFFSDLFLHGIIHIYFLNAWAIVLSFCGLIQLRVLCIKRKIILRFIATAFSENKLSTLVVLSIITALFFASLAPPTDADSLDYHLGVR